MTAATNKAVASTWIEAVLNRGDISAADNILSPDIQFHHPLVDLNGVDAMKQFVGSVRAAFPDIKFHVADYIVEGDRVAARWSLEGSQTREFRGKAPTNKKVSLPGITIMNLEDGKINEIWVAFDPAPLVSS